MLFAGTALFALGMLCLLVPAFLDGINGQKVWLVIALFVALMAAALVVWFRVLPDAMVLEYEAKRQKLGKAPLSTLPNAQKAHIQQLLVRLGFEETPSGLYRKRHPSGLKDAFWYYVALADSTVLTDTSDALLSQMEADHGRPERACLIAFLYKTGITGEDRQTLRTMACSLLSLERTLGGLAGFNIFLPVLADAMTGQGCYLDQPKGITLYAYGCRFLKKYLQ